MSLLLTLDDDVRMPGFRQKPEKDASVEKDSLTTLYQRCRGINIETLSADGGYRHSSLLAMSETEITCGLCQLIMSTHESKRLSWRLDRFKVILRLDLVDPQYGGRFKDHPDGSRHTGPGARIWVETLNTMPHLGVPEYSGGGKFGKPRLTGAPVGTVRGRPLHCFTEQFDPATCLGVHWVRKVGPNTASESSFKVARSWLKQCLSSEHAAPKDRHVLGGRNGPGQLPSVGIDHAWTAEQVDPSLAPEALLPSLPARLIDVLPDKGRANKVRLIETASESFEYATLSYCWGKLSGTDWLTTKDNLSLQLQGIRRDALPATVRECLVIVERLGIRYVWIDALCIIQGDSTDWAREAAKMAGIYRGSILTIAASSSLLSDGGCFNSKSSSHFEKFHKVVWVEAGLSDGQPSRLYICDAYWPDTYETEVLGGPLSSRAWTYQEQVLSRRTLHYAASQLFWTCEHCILTEDNSPPFVRDRMYPIFALDYRLTDVSLLDMWYLGAATEFSRRNITHASDKLAAISALAKATYLNKHVDYVAGLWKDSIITGLMWRSGGRGNKSKTYRCPSWSWASQDSIIEYNLATGRHYVGHYSLLELSKSDSSDKGAPYDDLFMPKVLKVSVELGSVHAFGSVKGGSLTLDTLSAAGSLTKQADPATMHTHALSFAERDESWQATAYMDNMDAAEGRTQEVLCAFIGYYYGSLVFLLLHPPNPGAKSYVRTGIALLDSLQIINSTKRSAWDMLDLMTRRTITIL